MNLQDITPDFIINEVVEFPEDVTLDQIIKMFDAAKRGLGIVNKLKNKDDRKKHARYVLTNLNKIRAMLYKFTKAID